jgi:hypothetical protein
MAMPCSSASSSGPTVLGAVEERAGGQLALLHVGNRQVLPRPSSSRWTSSPMRRTGSWSRSMATAR